MSVFQKLFAMLFLKAVPQNLPCMKSLAVSLTLLYWASGVLVLSSTLKPSTLMENMLLSVVILLVFIYGILRILNFQARFVQTFSAIVGVGLLFNLLSWPLLAVIADNSGTESLLASVSFIFLMLISWEVLVKAHIFKQALGTSMLNALLLSFSLFFITMTLSQLLFPAGVSH